MADSQDHGQSPRARVLFEATERDGGTYVLTSTAGPGYRVDARIDHEIVLHPNLPGVQRKAAMKGALKGLLAASILFTLFTWFISPSAAGDPNGGTPLGPCCGGIVLSP